MKKWMCRVCGYIKSEEAAPEQCPVCGAQNSFGQAAEEGPAEPESKPASEAAPVRSQANQWRCTACGYIHKGPEPPDKCPVCGADKSQFEPVMEEEPAVEPEKEQAAASVAPEAKAKREAKPAKAKANKWRCTVCGYIHEGPEPPDKCPVCGADKSQFEPVVEEAFADESGGEQGAAPAKPKTTPPPDHRRVDLGPLPKSNPQRFYHIVLTQMLKHHAHPISVHIPNGVVPLSFLFILLAALTGCKALGTAALCNMVFVLLSMPFVLFSGYVEWQKRYKGAKTDRFFAKIACACAVAALSLVSVVWWIASPDILYVASGGRWLFILVNFAMLVVAAIAGLIGGKFVFRD